MYDKIKQAVIDRFVEQVRSKIDLLETVDKVEVKILLGSPLRNSNPSVRVIFEGPFVQAEFGFWSNLTIFVTAVDMAKNEIIFCDNLSINDEGEADHYIDKVLHLFLEEDTSSSA